jgi:hypothetical protein
MRRAILVVVLAAGLAPPAGAESRPVVTVRVEVAAPSFRRELVAPGQATSPELEEAERGAAKEIAAALNEPPGFLAFGPGGATTLAVRVVAKAHAATALREIGLGVDVVGPGVGRGEPAYWVLRPQDDLRAAPSRPADLAREIAAKVAANQDALLRDVLSRVPIATTSALLKEPLGWIVPFTPEEICADFKSRFLIASEVQQSIGPGDLELPAEFKLVFNPRGETPLEAQRHRIVTFPTLPADHPDLLLLRGASASTVKAVRVTQYLRQNGCGRQPSPAEAFR